MNEERRGHWYLLTGLALGLAVGLIISLVLSPVRYIDAEPAALAERYKNEFRQWVALAYQADGNLPRASERLKLLQDADPRRELAAQAQRALGEGGSPDDARALAALAAALSGMEQVAVSTPDSGEQPTLPPPAGTELPPAEATRLAEAAVQTPTPPPPTPTPRATFTPRPSATPPRVLDAPFVLTSREEVCDGSLPEGRLVVLVFGRDGNPLAGVPVLVLWGEGRSSLFYTGLAPEISPGYADFQMEPGVSYTLRVGEASEAVGGLAVPACGGAWRVEFTEGGE